MEQIIHTLQANSYIHYIQLYSVTLCSFKAASNIYHILYKINQKVKSKTNYFFQITKCQKQSHGQCTFWKTFHQAQHEDQLTLMGIPNLHLSKYMHKRYPNKNET